MVVDHFEGSWQNNCLCSTYSVGQEGLTPLALACKEGSTDIVYQLVAAGAYVNLQVLCNITIRKLSMVLSWFQHINHFMIPLTPGPKR